MESQRDSPRSSASYADDFEDGIEEEQGQVQLFAPEVLSSQVETSVKKVSSQPKQAKEERVALGQGGIDEELLLKLILSCAIPEEQRERGRREKTDMNKSQAETFNKDIERDFEESYLDLIRHLTHFPRATAHVAAAESLLQVVREMFLDEEIVQAIKLRFYQIYPSSTSSSQAN